MRTYTLTHTHTYKPIGGNSFGDLALMYNSPRAATIRARTECTLWVLEKHFFRQAMVTSSSNQAGNLAQFLGKLKLFESLSLESLSQVSTYIHVCVYVYVCIYVHM